MNIQFDGQQVIIPIDKAILVLTRQQFLEALKAGKRFRRQQAIANWVAKAGEEGVSMHPNQVTLIGRVGDTGPLTTSLTNTNT